MIPLVDWVDTTVLGIHLISAVLFVGGSFFIYLILEPVSRVVLTEEKERMALIGRVARRFGRLVTPLLVVLVVTGLYNASWYLPGGRGLLSTVPGEVLLVKSLAVAVLIVLVYVHGAYFGPRIVALARAGRLGDLARLRRRSRKVAYANLGLMLAVIALAALLQGVG